MSTTSTSTAALTVAEYSARIGRALRTVGEGVVEGEVQKPRTTPGGMLVFDLTDGTAKLACKVFGSQVTRLEHRPRNGDLVQVRIDRPDIWAQAGKLDVIVSAIRLAGEGELLRRREELLVRLTAEGLCDPERRKPLPRFPRAVGVVAGRGSDGLRDVVVALQDRFPPVRIVTCAAIVQGARAPLDLIDALARLDAHPLVDVIVIARGGGSVQDLVAFDDERLCRAAFACSTPVIAAIGHTDNIPVCNHVAWAAETPSRAPELAVPSAAILRQELALTAAQLAPLRTRIVNLSEALAAIRLDAARVLQGLKSDVAATDAGLRDAEHCFFASRETGLAHAREALAAVPGRFPDVATVAALAGRIDTRAVAFFSERAENVRRVADFSTSVGSALGARLDAVRDTGRELRTVPDALAQNRHAVTHAAPEMRGAVAMLERRRERTNEHGDRLAAGIRKELSDHLRDFGRAFTRHTDAMARAAELRLTAEQQRVSESGTRLAEGARRRHAEALRGLEHVTALLGASDPRRRGWTLPTNDAGAVVRSVHELTAGDLLNLSFHDGTAGAVVGTVPNPEVS